MDEANAKLTERQREQLALIRRWQASGLGMKAFAEGEGLAVQVLYTAKQVLKRKGVLGDDEPPRRRFVRARIEPGSASAGAVCRVRLPNGCVVELGCPAQPEAWQALLAAVAALP